MRKRQNQLHAAPPSGPFPRWTRGSTFCGSAQAFSAIMGGVNSVTSAFDAAVRMPTFFRRIARNCPLILLGECNLDKVVDPAGGSWYLENLTDEASRQIWEFFQGIEKEGGIVKALKAGSIQKKVNATAAKRYELADQRRQSIVGVNQYVNLAEKKLEATEGSCCSAHKGHGCCKNADIQLPEVEMSVDSACKAAGEGFSTCLINKALVAGVDCKCGEPLEMEALPKRRLAERFESLFAKADAWVRKRGSADGLFANMGPRQHKARDFATSCAPAAGCGLPSLPTRKTRPGRLGKAATPWRHLLHDDTYQSSRLRKALRRPGRHDGGSAGYPADHVEVLEAGGTSSSTSRLTAATPRAIQNKIGL
ncbi:MAG: methylmalonyl-CoA mutase family protein [Akkermansia sp.]